MYREPDSDCGYVPIGTPRLRLEGCASPAAAGEGVERTRNRNRPQPGVMFRLPERAFPAMRVNFFQPPRQRPWPDSDPAQLDQRRAAAAA